MAKRMQKLLVALAAFAALAVGGAVFAQAQSAPPKAAETPSAVDNDNVQEGDQTGPDTETADKGDKGEKPGAEGPEQPGSEKESATDSDGPGGHADEPANPNANNQSNGAN